MGLGVEMGATVRGSDGPALTGSQQKRRTSLCSYGIIYRRIHRLFTFGVFTKSLDSSLRRWSRMRGCVFLGPCAQMCTVRDLYHYSQHACLVMHLHQGYLARGANRSCALYTLCGLHQRSWGKKRTTMIIERERDNFVDQPLRGGGPTVCCLQGSRVNLRSKYDYRTPVM